MTMTQQPDPPASDSAQLAETPLGLWGWTWRIGLAVVAFFLLRIVYELWLPPLYAPRPLITVGHDTTRIEAPVDAEGWVDYTAAVELADPSIPAEENAAVVLFEIMGPTGVRFEEREEFFAKLGMPTPPVEGDYLVNYELALHDGDHEKYKQRRDDFSYALFEPWLPERFPEIDAWLTSKQALVDRAVAMTQRKKWHIPLLGTRGPFGLGGASDPDVDHLLSASSLLLSHGFRAAAQGEIDNLLRDAEALDRLSKLLYENRDLVRWLVGFAIQHRALRLYRAYATHPNASPEQRAAVVAIVRNSKHPPKSTRQLDGYHPYIGLDGLQQFAKKANSAGEAQIDWNEASRELNRWYDDDVAIEKMPHGEAKVDEFFRVKDERKRKVDDSKSSLAWLRDWLLGSSLRTLRGRDLAIKMASELPSGAEIKRAYEQENECDLTLIAIGLAAYRAEHGSFPKSINDLPPAVFEGFYYREAGHERPLTEIYGYRAEEQGYLLWMDDTGRAETQTPPEEALEEGLYPNFRYREAPNTPSAEPKP